MDRLDSIQITIRNPQKYSNLENVSTLKRQEVLRKNKLPIIYIEDDDEGYNSIKDKRNHIANRIDLENTYDSSSDEDEYMVNNSLELLGVGSGGRNMHALKHSIHNDNQNLKNDIVFVNHSNTLFDKIQSQPFFMKYKR